MSPARKPVKAPVKASRPSGAPMRNGIRAGGLRAGPAGADVQTDPQVRAQMMERVGKYHLKVPRRRSLLGPVRDNHLAAALDACRRRDLRGTSAHSARRSRTRRPPRCSSPSTSCSCAPPVLRAEGGLRPRPRRTREPRRPVARGARRAAGRRGDRRAVVDQGHRPLVGADDPDLPPAPPLEDVWPIGDLGIVRGLERLHDLHNADAGASRKARQRLHPYPQRRRLVSLGWRGAVSVTFTCASPGAPATTPESLHLHRSCHLRMNRAEILV